MPTVRCLILALMLAAAAPIGPLHAQKPVAKIRFDDSHYFHFKTIATRTVIRGGATNRSRALRTLSKGTEIILLGGKNGFFHIQTRDGVNGWIPVKSLPKEAAEVGC